MKGKRACVWYSWSTDITGKAIAERLGLTHGYGVKKGANVIIVYGGNPKRKDGTRRSYPSDAFYFNHPDKVEANRNKHNALKVMSEHGISVPNFCKASDIHTSIQNSDMKYPVIGRMSKHQGGSGFYICLCDKDLKNALSKGVHYFMEYVKNNKEFRVHVFDGEVIKLTEKVQESEDADQWIRSNKRGWKFTRRSIENANGELLEEACNAVEAMELDFGAVDIIYSDDRKPYVIEINSGPSLNDNGLELYVSKFKAHLDKLIVLKKKRKGLRERLNIFNR